ncbi:hypothetical protein [Prosthecobacter sp.]|uniref:hypothetical protein n=1 Tax=Prosthecobacter sp. TaxID=1965333 RepID=UPI0037830046
MRKLKRATSLFTGRKDAPLEEASPPNLPPLTHEAEEAIRRKMSAAQFGDYMTAMVIEGLQRRDDMPEEELEERERNWQAKRNEYLLAIRALQKAPNNPPAWAESSLARFQKEMRGE